MNRMAAVAIAAAGALALASAVALAHSGATGVVKQRMDLMGTIGDAMKSLTDMMRGKTRYDAGRVRALARTIGDHGGDRMTGLFPKDSLQHPTEALPSIWTDWNRFSALAGELSRYAKALETSAGNGRPGPGAGGMMGGGGSGGMMGRGMMGQGMGMMAGGQGMMMGGAGRGPSSAQLAQMPPDAAFMHLAQTCSACHLDFRKEQ